MVCLISWYGKPALDLTCVTSTRFFNHHLPFVLYKSRVSVIALSNHFALLHYKSATVVYQPRIIRSPWKESGAFFAIMVTLTVRVVIIFGKFSSSDNSFKGPLGK